VGMAASLLNDRAGMERVRRDYSQKGGDFKTGIR
jgi:hypothetical protein